MMKGGPISWKSRRKDNVSLSTSKAESVAASQTAQEVVYIYARHSVILDTSNLQPLTFFKDNLACIAMSENLDRRKFSRHIDIRRYFVNELDKARILKLIPLRTHKMVAGASTKSLPSPAFFAQRNVMLGQVPSSLKILGGCRTCISA